MSSYVIDVEVDEKYLVNKVKEIFYKREGKEYVITDVMLTTTSRSSEVTLSFKGLDNVYVVTTVESYVDKNGKFELIVGEFDLEDFRDMNNW